MIVKLIPMLLLIVIHNTIIYNKIIAEQLISNIGKLANFQVTSKYKMVSYDTLDQIQLQRRVKRAQETSNKPDPPLDIAVRAESQFDEADSPLSSLSEEKLTPPISGEDGADIRDKRCTMQGKMKGELMSGSFSLKENLPVVGVIKSSNSKTVFLIQ